MLFYSLDPAMLAHLLQNGASRLLLLLVDHLAVIHGVRHVDPSLDSHRSHVASQRFIKELAVMLKNPCVCVRLSFRRHVFVFVFLRPTLFSWPRPSTSHAGGLRTQRSPRRSRGEPQQNADRSAYRLGRARATAAFTGPSGDDVADGVVLAPTHVQRRRDHLRQETTGSKWCSSKWWTLLIGISREIQRKPWPS